MINYKNTRNNVGSNPVVFGLAKVVKIRLVQFKVVPTRKDKNCTSNSVGMFMVQNQVIGPSFQLCLLGACSGGVRARKICKNLTETFSAIAAGNDKNCTPNSVGMSRVQN